ncbi:MAG TPA: phosphoribosylformylglycinamidine cyclo-ligase [Verrucomicrobiae bacterium]|nr:phosphoribosylformylglycinamidine cyclo-ligase [Verrucomicrobiae bacterium]
MKSWTYEKAGVPHLKGDPSYNRKITSLIHSTRIPGVLGSATGFASLFDVKKSGVRDPLLVTSTDGVGTKLEIARARHKHDTIGVDLVAMCVNDIITCGAQPIIFLDYFATGKFEAPVMAEVLKGIVNGCRQAGCALTGGETAIMPGFYQSHNGSSQYDVAGFSVGVVDRSRIITGNRIEEGDLLLGLASTGFHSNGYSLLRRLFSAKQLRGEAGKKLLTPTRIYVKPVLRLLRSVPIAGIVNITGGGMIDNLPRVIPQGLGAEIDPLSWPRPKLFQWVQDSGNIPSFEMFRTFNMGIGMVLVLKPRALPAARRILQAQKLPSWVIGTIRRTKGEDPRVRILF